MWPFGSGAAAPVYYIKLAMLSSSYEILAADKKTALYSVKTSALRRKRTVHDLRLPRRKDEVATIHAHSFSRTTECVFTNAKGRSTADVAKRGFRGKRYEATLPSTGRDVYWKTHTGFTSQKITCRDGRGQDLAIIEIGSFTKTLPLRWLGDMANPAAERERFELMVVALAVYASYRRAQSSVAATGASSGC